MSKEYDLYLKEHRDNVRKGFEWLCDNLADIIDMVPRIVDLNQQIIFGHDSSKDALDEYEPYDAWFYGKNPSYAVKCAYNKAWLQHIHRNPHHYQYWILIHDDPDEGTECIPIPLQYIIEMICDWWAFSWKDGNRYEIFDWYKEHGPYMQIEDTSRKKIDYILKRMKEKLDYEDALRCLKEDR